MALVIGAALSGCRGSNAGVTSIAIEEGKGPVSASSWRERGFVELVPAIRPPSTADLADRIEVWIRLPPADLIRLEPSGDSLVVPSGTAIDRVESFAQRDGAAWVADVRGTEFADDGGERFHVLRRTGPRLEGFAWPRGDPWASGEASSRLVDLLHEQRAGEASIRRLRELNDCAGCHAHDKPASARLVEGGLPNRRTDSSGLYSLDAVLTSKSPIETARPWDTNLDDPFVRVVCPEGAPIRLASKEGRSVRCPGGAVPIAELDVAAAIDAGDAHAEAVCRSRRFLFEHMDDRARARIEREIGECEGLTKKKR